jgi:hypothetical protein
VTKERGHNNRSDLDDSDPFSASTSTSNPDEDGYTFFLALDQTKVALWPDPMLTMIQLINLGLKKRNRVINNFEHLVVKKQLSP